MSAKAGSAARNELVIIRVFDAPRELVWKAWTEPERLMRWWGPKAFTTPVYQMDFRVGGKYLSCMESADGKRYWSTGVFVTIQPPSRLVMTDCFADENGNIVPATHYGMGADTPLEMHISVEFEEVPGGTRMTLIHTGLPAGEMKDGANTGWNESFDRLADFLHAGGIA